MQNKLNWLEVIGIETPLAKSETRIYAKWAKLNRDNKYKKLTS